MSIRGCGYITDAFLDMEKIVESFNKCLNDNLFGDFDGIACRGTSGLLVAPVLAHAFQKKLIVVRKSGDGSHAGGNTLEGHDDAQKYIIVDDFTESGRTLEAIVDGIKTGAKHWCLCYQPIYVGCYFWSTAFNNDAYKQKIYESNTARYKKVAKDKVFISRYGRHYKVDDFNDDSY